MTALAARATGDGAADSPAGPPDPGSAAVGGYLPVGPVATVGDPAPQVELTDQHGSAYSLTRARTRGPVLLVFFPFAFSGVCTGEMAALRGLDESLAATGTTLVAVSCDQLFALRVFADSLELPFPLLSDFWPHGAVARSYGVFDAERGCAVRGSFLVDRAGILRWSVVNPISAGRDLTAHVSAATALAAELAGSGPLP